MAETSGTVLDNLQIKATGNVQDAIAKIDQLIAKLNGLKNASTTAATGEKKLATETKSASKEMKSVSTATSKATSGLSKLASSIGRVAFYRVIRSAIKAVTSGFKEGIDNAYAWATANGDAFKRTMDTYASYTNYLKNSLGALSSTILTAFLPAFVSVINTLVDIINKVNEAVAIATNQPDYLRARYVEIEHGAEDAAKAQKKLNIQLMAFDEINNITTPSSGGSSDAEKWKDAFERVTTPEGSNKNILSEVFVRPITIAYDFLKKIGSYVSEKIKPQLEKAQPIIDKIATSFSTVNDIVSEIFDLVYDIFVNILDQVDIVFLVDNFDEMSGSTGDILTDVKEIVKKLKDSGFLQDLAKVAGQLVDLVLKLTVFGSSTALKSIDHVLEMILGILNADVKQFINGLKGAIQDLFVGLARSLGALIDKFNEIVLHKNTNWADELAARWEHDSLFNTTPKTEGGFSGTSGGHSFGNITDVDGSRAAAAAAAVVSQNDKRSIRLDLNDLNTFAGGGLPDMGSVFVAGEVPGSAEMVGNINGRTGVASGEEITGIASAVYATGNEEADLLRQILGALRSGGNSRPNAAFGRFASQSIALYKGVTG